jgi:hypothetical protein
MMDDNEPIKHTFRIPIDSLPDCYRKTFDKVDKLISKNKIPLELLKSYFLRRIEKELNGDIIRND